MGDKTKAELQAELDALKKAQAEGAPAGPSQEDLDQANARIKELEDEAQAGEPLLAQVGQVQTIPLVATPDQALQARLGQEDTVKVRVLFNDISFKDGEGLHVVARDEDYQDDGPGIVSIPQSEYKRLTSEGASLPPGFDPARPGTGDNKTRYPVERV